MLNGSFIMNEFLRLRDTLFLSPFPFHFKCTKAKCIFGILETEYIFLFFQIDLGQRRPRRTLVPRRGLQSCCWSPRPPSHRSHSSPSKISYFFSTLGRVEEFYIPPPPPQPSRFLSIQNVVLFFFTHIFSLFFPFSSYSYLFLPFKYFFIAEKILGGGKI